MRAERASFFTTASASSTNGRGSGIMFMGGGGGGGIFADGKGGGGGGAFPGGAGGTARLGSINNICNHHREKCLQNKNLRCGIFGGCLNVCVGVGGGAGATRYTK